MLTGRFGDTTGRPYIEGRLVLPRLNITANVSFIIDTGADCTVLMPLDGARMGVDYTQLQNVVDSVGIGGVARDFTENAIVAFSDGANLYTYTLTLRVSTPSPDIMRIPSLLGRDILNRWEAIFDYTNGRLLMNVRSADMTIPIPSALPPLQVP